MKPNIKSINWGEHYLSIETLDGKHLFFKGAYIQELQSESQLEPETDSFAITIRYDNAQAKENTNP